MKVKHKRRRRSVRGKARDRAFRDAWMRGLFQTIWRDCQIGPDLGRAVSSLGTWPQLDADGPAMEIFRCPG